MPMKFIFSHFVHSFDFFEHENPEKNMIFGQIFDFLDFLEKCHFL